MSTTDLLKTLRDETGISVMQCKKALDEAGGDMDKARMILKKKSGDAAAKKADRELGAGLVVTAQGNGKTVMLTLLCETDFVAKNDDFVKLAKTLANKTLEVGADGANEASAEMLGEAIQKLGENIKLGTVFVTDSPNAGVYNHNGQYASVVVLKEKNDDLARDIAMHATAMRPGFLSEADISDEAKTKAKEVFQKEVDAQSADKPEEMKAKILEGKVNAFFKEQILGKQMFIKDPSKTIDQLLKEANNEIISFKIEAL